jgi:hypothetical protein
MLCATLLVAALTMLPLTAYADAQDQGVGSTSGQPGTAMGETASSAIGSAIGGRVCGSACGVAGAVLGRGVYELTSTCWT